MILSIFDFILIAIIILIVVKATMNGFIYEFFSKASVIVGIFGGILFYKKLTPLVIKILGTEVFPEIISFLFIFLWLYLLVKIVQHFLSSILEGETLNNLDRALGFFWGIAEGSVIIFFIFLIIKKQPWFDLLFLSQKSIIFNILDTYTSDIKISEDFFSQFLSKGK